MKYYIKNNEIKSAKQIVIRKNGMQTFNPSEEMILANGWVEYVPTLYEPTVEDVRANKIKEILDFDSSEEVNSFYIGDFEVWLDKATRVGLKLRFDAEIASGKTETILWYEGMQFPLELANAVQMLNAIELYASACYDNTQAHIANVKAFEFIEEIEDYDYSTGYPEKLRF